MENLVFSLGLQLKMWRTTAREAHSESELEYKRPSRLNRIGYQETGRRMSTDQTIVEPIKIVEIDTYNTYSHHHQQLNDRTPRGNSYVTRQAHSIPNYMSTTASAVARFRPQSAPRQRSNRISLDDNEPRIKLVRKRLSFHKDTPQSHDYFWYDKKMDAHEDYQY